MKVKRIMTTKFEAAQPQPCATRFLLADERVERIVMLAKEQRAAYIAKLFAAGRSWLAEYRRDVRACAPSSLIRGESQA
jgi:hypothetical protein